MVNQQKEKKDLLAAGFRDWNKQNYFKWVKSVSTHGRNEFKLIANEMKMPVENIQRYTEAFFSLAKTRLGEREYKRVMKQVEIGDQKRAQSLTFSKRLGTFLKTFNDPRNEMVFINKGDGEWERPSTVPLLKDVIMAAVSAAVFAALVYFHASLFGVSPIPV